MAKLDEADIMARLNNPEQKRKAFEDLVNLYSRKLYWQIHHVVQNHQDTDDVLQNTFIKAWKGIDTFNGDSALSTWLYRIAMNESATWLSKQSQYSSSVDSDAISNSSSFMADEYFDGDSAQKILMEAVSTLPIKQKQVFCMKYFDNRKFEEISELVGTSVGALKASYHIAVEKIAKYVKTKEFD